MTPLRRRLETLRVALRAMVATPEQHEEITRALATLSERLERLERVVDEQATSRHLDALRERAEGIGAGLDALRQDFGVSSGREMDILHALYTDIPGNRRRLWRLRASPDYAQPFTEPDPLVSVCIPTYNNLEDLVGRSLPSVLGQTYENLEIIVVGDAAPPEVEEAVLSFHDKRIRYVNLTVRGPYPQEPMMMWLVAGAEPAREALRLSRGSWIAEHSDDDVFLPDHVEALLADARERRLEIVYGKIRRLDPDGPDVILGTFPPTFAQFGLQAMLLHGGFRLFPHEPLVAFHMPADQDWIDLMMKIGARIGMIDQIVTDYYPSQLWKAPARTEGS